jgi:hypothetical protein
LLRLLKKVSDSEEDEVLAQIRTDSTRLPQPEQGMGDAWILIAFIVVLGLIFVVAAWVLAGSDVLAEGESTGQGIIASSTPT